MPIAATMLLAGFVGGMPYNTAVVLRGVTVLGIVCGVLGTFLLLRRRALVADALSHAALPGVCAGFLVAAWLGIDGRSLPILLAGAALAAALGIGALHLLSSVPRIREDAAIGAVLSVFFAVGVVLLGYIGMMDVGGKAGLHQFIFGQAATMRAGEANGIALVALLCLLVTALAFKELRLLCFDASFGRAMGYSRLALDGLLMGLVLVVTVIGLHSVGALLMVALLIIPAAAARFWTDRLGVTAAVAGLIGGAGALGGAAASAMAADVPTGPAIVLACGGLFLLSMMLGAQRGIAIEALRHWTAARQVARQHVLRAMYERGEIVGNLAAPVATTDLLERRAWSEGRLRRLLRRLAGRGDLRSAGGGHALTDQGRAAAIRIVRTHRLWEHYLTTHAEIAPTHVDRAADDIEHVLGEQLVGELEATLEKKIPLPREQQRVPPSPHRLGGESPPFTP